MFVTGLRAIVVKQFNMQRGTVVIDSQFLFIRHTNHWLSFQSFYTYYLKLVAEKKLICVLFFKSVYCLLPSSVCYNFTRYHTIIEKYATALKNCDVKRNRNIYLPYLRVQ